MDITQSSQDPTASAISLDPRVLNLKKRIVWYCYEDLTPLDDRQGKDLSENELVAELDRVIERVKDTRKEYHKADQVLNSNAPMREARKYYCERCGNKDPNNIIHDPKSGDSICAGKDGGLCGNVLQDHSVFEGAAHRNFEDSEEDRNHHGPLPDMRMPDHINLEVRIADHGRGREYTKTDFNRMMKANQMIARKAIEGYSNDRRTSAQYKAEHKRFIFGTMDQLACNLNIHKKSRRNCTRRVCAIS